MTRPTKSKSKSKQYLAPSRRKEGTAAKYITRNKALNRLQIKLPEFRRLCILKGIHPREPKKKVEGHNKTYYHMKDIAFLAHEPLLERSRELKAYEKKITKARAKRNLDLVQRLLGNKPEWNLNHLVNERYPSFVDALRDLDDPLTILHLFAWLPADNSQKIRPEHIESARRLSLQWQAYCIRVRALRKVFVSVKGVYYQAEVGGQNITWLTPHSTSQVLPSDVDFRVMLTFLEFYKTLVGFVNFKLYHDLGLRYPPLLDAKLEKAANELYGLMKGLSSAAPVTQEAPKAVEGDDDAEMTEQEDPRAVESQVRLASLHSRLSAIDKEQEKPAPVPEAANEPEDEGMDSSVKLFKEFKFFLGREVPREALLFVIRAFGGTVSWDGEGAPFPESDESITHQIVDRPTQGHKFLSREYVQPQWVFDSVNNKFLLPTDAYVVGKSCPPHLSPFVDSEAEGYMPEYAETIKRMQAAAPDDLPVFESKPAESNVETDMSTADVTVSLERSFTRDLSKEMAGISYSASLEGKVETPREEEGKNTGVASEAVPEADEAVQMGRMMMTRKARGLYDAAKMGQAKKAAKIDLLKERKKKAKGEGK